MGETPQQGNLEFFKKLVWFSLQEAPKWRHLRGCYLGFEIQNLSFCREPSCAATSWWATFILNKIKLKNEAKLELWNGATSKGVWDLNLEAVGECHVAPHQSGTCQKNRAVGSEGATSEEFEFYFFWWKEIWTCGSPGWFHTWQVSAC